MLTYALAVQKVTVRKGTDAPDTEEIGGGELLVAAVAQILEPDPETGGFILYIPAADEGVGTTEPECPT